MMPNMENLAVQPAGLKEAAALTSAGLIQRTLPMQTIPSAMAKANPTKLHDRGQGDHYEALCSFEQHKGGRSVRTRNHCCLKSH